tara:strand:+ start:1288 stop:1746 length:459 start_codon:yes stop_codon:yes gene_type:complete
MEVIEEAQEVQQENQVTNEIVLILGRAIVDLLESTPTVNGKMLYALGKNESKFEKLAKSYRDKQWELLAKYAETNEDGSIKMIDEEEANGSPNRFVFKGEDEEQKYQSEMTKYLSTPVELNLHKIDKALFENLNVNPQRNRSFTILVDYLSE